VTYSELINELFDRFPVLEKQYEKEGDYVAGLPHLCYEIIFVPFIRQACLNNEQEKLYLICEFLEQMANSEDDRISEVLVVSVLESVLSERDIIYCLKSYLGVHTMELLSVLEREYGWS
jgi:hypothetical protein